MEDYKMYLFMCHCEGDIWNSDNRPYTYEEWLSKGSPESGGISIK